MALNMGLLKVSQKLHQMELSLRSALQMLYE